MSIRILRLRGRLLTIMVCRVLISRDRGRYEGRGPDMHLFCRLPLLRLSVTLLAVSMAPHALAQQPEQDVTADRFTQHFWSQSRPDRGYLNGCVTGYRAFTFSADGHFVFDRKLHGTWRPDRLNNLVLRLRDGTTVRLFFDGQRTLTPSLNGGAFRRDQRFQECRD